MNPRRVIIRRFRRAPKRDVDLIRRDSSRLRAGGSLRYRLVGARSERSPVGGLSNDVLANGHFDTVGRYRDERVSHKVKSGAPKGPAVCWVKGWGC